MKQQNKKWLRKLNLKIRTELIYRFFIRLTGLAFARDCKYGSAILKLNTIEDKLNKYYSNPILKIDWLIIPGEIKRDHLNNYTCKWRNSNLTLKNPNHHYYAHEKETEISLRNKQYLQIINLKFIIQ